ncbi:ATP-binding cassette domain-containing protein [Microbacteriaceae bacterium K1510]|nr:ATP-binding cassette domain-containing protein [Microbacteriaceae bacterium K1510]
MNTLVLPRADTAKAFERVDAPRIAAAGLPIRITGLRKAFGSNEVLRGLDFDVPAGEFVAIVGRSGCGKSTLLRLLVGLDQPTGGAFRIGQRADNTIDRHEVRVMFQEPRLLPWASVLSNVEVGLGSDRKSPGAREKALQTLSEVGLADRRDEWPSVLSGGQKQRVALARALVSQPRVLAFDEPLGALDALTRISMQRLLERVWLDQRFTALLVTHDVAEAVTLADRVLVIEEGRIALDLRIDLPRPRERGSAEVAALEGQILHQLFKNAEAGEDA